MALHELCVLLYNDDIKRGFVSSYLDNNISSSLYSTSDIWSNQVEVPIAQLYLNIFP